MLIEDEMYDIAWTDSPIHMHNIMHERRHQQYRMTDISACYKCKSNKHVTLIDRSDDEGKYKVYFCSKCNQDA